MEFTGFKKSLIESHLMVSVEDITLFNRLLSG